MDGLLIEQLAGRLVARFEEGDYRDPDALASLIAEIVTDLEAAAVENRGADRNSVYIAIDSERDYQDSLRSDRTDGRAKSVGDYLTMLHAYLRQADTEYISNPGDQPALHAVRKIAGIAVQCMEVHGAPLR